MTDYLRDWYYMEPNWRGDSFVRGPFTHEQMRELIKGGTIDGKTQVRCGPNSYWHPLKEVSAIFSAPAMKGKANNDATPFSIRKMPQLGKKQKALLAAAIAVIALFYFGGGKEKSIPDRGPFPSNAIPGRGSFSNTSLPGRTSFHKETLTKEAIIDATNNSRTSQGLSALVENPLLDIIAETRAKDMIEKQYFGHVSPTGEQASDIAQRVGYKYRIIAENIASGLFLTNQKLVDGWMQSPGHRKNLLSSEVQDIGVSVIRGQLQGSDTWVSVQVFGLQSLPVSHKNCIRPSLQLERDMEFKTTEVRTLNERTKALRQELDDEKYSIDLERLSVGNDANRNHRLRVKIKVYNEKVRWYNQTIAETQAKATVLKSMIEEHDKEVQIYRDCQGSN